MKNILTIAILLCSIITAGFSQSYIAQIKPEGSKYWGYCDESGTIIIEPAYKKCFGFSEDGLAIYNDRSKGSLVVINTKGEQVPTSITGFRLIEQFGFGVQGYHEGMLAVSKNEKWGYLDTNGELVLKGYDFATIFNSERAIVKKGGEFLIIDKQGNETNINVPNLLTIKRFSEGLAPFTTNNRLSGFIDINGNIVIEPKYNGVGYFQDGLAWARSDNDLTGFIDKTGQWVIDPKFLKVGPFDSVSGMTRVKTSSGWAYSNKEGVVMSISDTDIWKPFNDGLALGRKQGKIGFFDKEGNWVIPPSFEVAKDFKNGFAPVRKGELWGFIDTKGEWVIPPTFVGVKDFEKVL